MKNLLNGFVMCQFGWIELNFPESSFLYGMNHTGASWEIWKQKEAAAIL